MYRDQQLIPENQREFTCLRVLILRELPKKSAIPKQREARRSVNQPDEPGNLCQSENRGAFFRLVALVSRAALIARFPVVIPLKLGNDLFFHNAA
jgi:hypothetical protein